MTTKPISNTKIGNVSVATFENNGRKSYNMQVSFLKNGVWVNKTLNVFERDVIKLSQAIVHEVAKAELDVQKKAEQEVEHELKQPLSYATHS